MLLDNLARRLRGALRLAFAAGVCVFGSMQFAAADVVTMDSFSVNGSFFTDPFNLSATLSGTADSGVTANTSPSAKEIFYSVTGSFSESGGKSTLNTANGELQASSPPFDPLVRQVGAIISPTVFSLGRTNAVSISGVFDLGLPATPGAAYGVELVDLNRTHNGDVVGLRIFQTAAGPRIELVNLDHYDGTVSVIDALALDPGHDQIELNLFKGASSDAVGGSFAYLDGGKLGALTTFGDATTLASDQSVSFSAGFDAVAPVPEPATLALFGSGLAALGWIRRRQARNAAQPVPTASA